MDSSNSLHAIVCLALMTIAATADDQAADREATMRHLCASVRNSHMVLDPWDCGAFYACLAHGTMARYVCPLQLLWNDEVKVCDWSWNVVCAPAPGNYAGKPLQT
ncbi:PREDICTED: probable chitinase 3 [Priapulus caudatus]|uniref:Probable chitinase 3 n=1 Tax=Priapulus caudatus TaxID=37621 RepID=A0ABM1ESN8_PRICU|nr:PREDICTED: probable chitinase 3 [Priapulus caudatus]